MSTKPNFHRLAAANLRLAKLQWGSLRIRERQALTLLSKQYQLSVAFGDLLLIDSQWYVTHSGLLRLATRKACAAIRTEPVPEFCDSKAARWVFNATVYKSARSKGFVGYGDADPSNVSSFVHGAEMRMAETRAVNRALRKAYGIGLCSIEELGSSRMPPASVGKNNQPNRVPLNGNEQPRVRDRLYQLIRQYSLDPNLVKQYAVAFCGTENLREASREKIEEFVNTISQEAIHNRESLVDKLSSYSRVQEGQL